MSKETLLPTDEVEALYAVMESVDPATFPGLSANHRAVLGRFAKPASSNQAITETDYVGLVRRARSIANTLPSVGGGEVDQLPTANVLFELARAVEKQQETIDGWKRTHAMALRTIDAEHKFATDDRAAYLAASREADSLRKALEEKGVADVYRDGFDAAIAVADSLTVHADWGPEATPDDGLAYGLKSMRDVLHRARSALAKDTHDNG